MRNIFYGSISHSEPYQIIDAISGVGRPGLFATNLYGYFARMGSFISGFPLISIPPTGLWIAGGFSEISGALAPGLYRLDPPNEAFAPGSAAVVIGIYGTGIISEPKEFRLSYFNDQQNPPVPTANQIAAVAISSGISTFNSASTAVAVSGNYDKVGYSLSVSDPTANQIAAVIIASGVSTFNNFTQQVSVSGLFIPTPPTANQISAVAIASGISTFNPLLTATTTSGVTNYVLNQIVNAISASGLGGDGNIGEPLAEGLVSLLQRR